MDQTDFYKERDTKGFDAWSDDYIAEISIRVLSDIHSRTCIEYDNLEVKNDERKKDYFKDLMENILYRKSLIEKQVDLYVDMNRGSMADDIGSASYAQKLRYLIETEDDLRDVTIKRNRKFKHDRTKKVMRMQGITQSYYMMESHTFMKYKAAD